MASIAVLPLVLKDVTMTLGANGYEKHVSSVTFTPKSSTISWQGLTPTATFTDSTTAEWTCDLEYVQDWDTTNSLSKYLLANAGTSVTGVFKPKQAGTPTFTATVTLQSGAIGGKVNAYATTSVSLGSTVPVLT
jgi:hypothetical protein